MRFPIAVAIPNNYFELLRAINDGEPVSPERKSEFNQKLAGWASQIVFGMAGPEGAAKKKQGFAFWR